MKKLFSLTLALLLGLASFAQITQDAYWQNFENTTGWTVDAANQGVNWEVGDIFENGDQCAYAATTNIAFYAPSITLTSDDIEDGSIEFYLLTALNGTSGPETSSVSLIVIVGQDVQLISIGQLSSSAGWYLVNVSFEDLAEQVPALNITSGSKTVTIGIVHSSNTNGCYLILDDFKIRKRSNAYVVKFHPTDGSGTMNDMVTNDEAGMTAPTCTFTAPSGKRFAYWYAVDNEGNDYAILEGDEIEDLDQDYYFYAIWGSTFTVNYNANGGSGNMTAGTGVQYVGYTVLDNAFSRQGYTFTGWNTEADGTGVDYDPGDNLKNMDGEGELLSTSVTLYAQWSEDQGGGTITSYTIHFDGNGGTGTMNDATVDAGDYYTVPSCGFTRSGYSFLTWNTQANGTGTSYSPGAEISINANLTLYAIWDQNGGQGGGTQGTSYTVRYNGNGGTGSMTEQTVTENSTITLRSCQFTRNGFTFTGWNTAANGTGASYNPGDEVVITSNITFYAQWAEDGQGGGGQGGGTTTSYTIHFVANGGTGTMNDANVETGEYYTIPSCGFTRDGYTFLTWNTQPDGSGSSYGPGSEISISANLTLYAIWDQNGGQGGGTQGTTYTVRYNGNGGVGTMTEQTVADNTTITLRSCQFTRDGFTFTGWNTAADGTGASYNPGDEVTITSNMTFYAQWQRNGSSAINGVAMASVSIYPNPASNMVVVSGTNASRIEVLDLAGRIVRIAESTNTVSLSGLTNGVYTLRITAAEGIATRKLLKK